MSRINELSKQNKDLKEIEYFNEALRSEISVQKRVAYKVEDKIDQTERIKKRQDYLVSQLTEEKLWIIDESKVVQ